MGKEASHQYDISWERSSTTFGKNEQSQSELPTRLWVEVDGCGRRTRDGTKRTCGKVYLCPSCAAVYRERQLYLVRKILQSGEPKKISLCNRETARLAVERVQGSIAAFILDLPAVPVRGGVTAYRRELLARLSAIKTRYQELDRLGFNLGEVRRASTKARTTLKAKTTTRTQIEAVEAISGALARSWQSWDTVAYWQILSLSVARTGSPEGQYHILRDGIAKLWPCLNTRPDVGLVLFYLHQTNETHGLYFGPALDQEKLRERWHWATGGLSVHTEPLKGEDQWVRYSADAWREPGAQSQPDRERGYLARRGRHRAAWFGSLRRVKAGLAA